MTGPPEGDVYLVVGSKPWNRVVYDEVIAPLPGTWSYLDDRTRLEEEVTRLAPRYAFFLHWSWKVPPSVLDATECVCFHMTDVPYGRGGSPLQNLIVRGHDRTKLTALRMVDMMDAGDVYMKRDLELHGTAEEIYVRATRLAAEMVAEIIRQRPSPTPQSGDVVTFTRRRPADSAIPPLSSLDAVYDFIRMLDADGYPHAFIEHNGYVYRFTRAVRYDGRVAADVTITPVGQDE